MKNLIFILITLFTANCFAAAGRNWASQATVLTPVPVASVTSSGNGTDFDLQGYQGEILIMADVKATSGTNPTMDISINDSADNSSFAALSPSVAFSQFTSTTAIEAQKVIRVSTLRRYLRVVKVIGGTAIPTFLMNVQVVAQKKYPQ